MPEAIAYRDASGVFWLERSGRVRDVLDESPGGDSYLVEAALSDRLAWRDLVCADIGAGEPCTTGVTRVLAGLDLAEDVKREGETPGLIFARCVQTGTPGVDALPPRCAGHERGQCVAEPVVTQLLDLFNGDGGTHGAS